MYIYKGKKGKEIYQHFTETPSWSSKMLSSFHQETRDRSKLMYSTVPFPNFLPSNMFWNSEFWGFLTGDTVCIHHVFLTPLKKAEMAHRGLGQCTIIKHLLFLQWNLQIHKIKTHSSQEVFWKTKICAKHKRKIFGFRSIVDKDWRSYKTVPIAPLLNVCAKCSW